MSAAAERTHAPLVFQCTVAAPPEVVFDAFFRHPQRWLCRTSEIEARPGGSLRFCWPDGEVRGHFVQFVPPATGRFSWHTPGDDLPNTMVVVSVMPTERNGQPASAVEVEHYGFGTGGEWDLAYLGATRAWAGYLKNLRSVLEGGLDLREAGE